MIAHPTEHSAMSTYIAIETGAGPKILGSSSTYEGAIAFILRDTRQLEIDCDYLSYHNQALRACSSWGAQDTLILDIFREHST